ISFTLPWHLAQDGAHVVVSSWKQQNVDRAVATLQGERLNMTGTVCHVGKAEKRESLQGTDARSLVKLGQCPRQWLLCGPEQGRCQAGEPIVVTVGALGCWGHQIPGVSAAVIPLVGSNLGAGKQLGDKILDVNYHQQTAPLGLTKSLAVELSPQGIRVHGVSPGLVKTDFSRVSGVAQPGSRELEDRRSLGGQGSQRTVGTLSFLCSPDASYITGENVVVAGFSLRL
ncbi:hypothetical protein E2I00_018500, partial [Balaenoptera physalus]